MSEFKVEKGVPMPQRKHGRKGESIYPWRELEIGDSFFMPTDAKRVGLYTLASKHGIKIAARKEGAGFRVWRIA